MKESAYREHFEVEDRHWWYRGRWAVVEALLSRVDLPADPRILDAGCGTGGNLRKLRRLGIATGVELSSEALGFCRERGLEDVHQASLESLPFEDASFDLVVSTDVIEHVAGEQKALGELRRVTASRGILTVTVPAYMWLWSSEDDNLHHHRRYTKKRLRRAVREAGWEPLFASYFNSLLLPPIAVAKKVRRGSEDEAADLDRTPAALNGPLSVPMRLEARAIRAGVSLPAGVSVGVVCRRRD